MSSRALSVPPATGTVCLFAALLALAGVLAVTSSVRAEEEGGRASIAFADLGGIKNWRALSNNTLLIEGRNDRWFEATTFGPCIGMRFADTIGFVTDPTGDLDRFSSIYVDGQRCWFRSFKEVEDPNAEQ